MTRNATRLAKRVREMAERIRALETSFHDFGGHPKTHVLLTYTPEKVPIAKEEYQLSVPQIQEFFGALFALLAALEPSRPSRLSDHPTTRRPDDQTTKRPNDKK